MVLQLFDTLSSTAVMAAERFAAVKQASVLLIDDFANKLTHLASLTFPNLPPRDRDSLILHRLITGLRDANTTSILLLRPPVNLTAATRHCRLHAACYSDPTSSTATLSPEAPPPNQKASPTPAVPPP
ncbi:hypothetical protein SprV_0501784500 [Sparganum proliferum]